MFRTKYRTIVQSFNVHAICISRDYFCCWCCCCKVRAIFICSKIIVCEPHFFALFSQDKQNWIQNLNMLCTFRLVWRKNRFGLFWERSHIHHIFNWNAYRFVDGAFNTFVVLLSSCSNFFITMTNQETNKLHTCMRICATVQVANVVFLLCHLENETPVEKQICCFRFGSVLFVLLLIYFQSSGFSSFSFSFFVLFSFHFIIVVVANSNNKNTQLNEQKKYSTEYIVRYFSLSLPNIPL